MLDKALFLCYIVIRMKFEGGVFCAKHQVREEMSSCQQDQGCPQQVHEQRAENRSEKGERRHRSELARERRSRCRCDEENRSVRRQGHHPQEQRRKKKIRSCTQG